MIKIEQVNRNKRAAHSGSPKNLDKTEDHTDTNSKRIEWNKGERKNSPHRQRWIRKKSPWSIWSDGYTAHWTYEISRRKKASWVPWFFCHTQNGHWDDHGVYRETPSQKWQSCQQSKPTNANPPERRPKCWYDSDAHVRGYHSTTNFQVRKSNFCTKET